MAECIRNASTAEPYLGEVIAEYLLPTKANRSKTCSLHHKLKVGDQVQYIHTLEYGYWGVVDTVEDDGMCWYRYYKGSANYSHASGLRLRRLVCENPPIKAEHVVQAYLGDYYGNFK